MEKEDYLKKIAPCGLVCYTCTMAKDGIIREHSLALLGLLENFDTFAEKFADYEPRLRHYASFNDLLNLLAEASCDGCRGGHCMYQGCVVQPCTHQKGVDFCFQCAEFPCAKVDFDRGLKIKWLTANRKMKRIGVEAYFEQYKHRSHYT